MNRYLNQKKGLTLVELVIAMAIFSIVILSVYSFFNFGNKSFNASSRQYNTQSDVRLAVDYASKEVRFATNFALLNTIDPATLVALDKFSYIYIKDGALVHNIYNNGSARKIISYGQGIKDTSYFYAIKDGLNQNIGMAIVAEDGEQDFDLDAKFALPNININGAFITNTVSAKAVKYLKNTQLAAVTPPAPPGGGGTPVPPATPIYVTVTIELEHQNYKVYFDGVLQAITKVNGKESVVIANVPVSTSHALKVDEKQSGSFVTIRDISAFAVGTADMVRKVADI
jgi:prepilin-type N-terminal cleavage/methylation domain-containing protein